MSLKLIRLMATVGVIVAPAIGNAATVVVDSYYTASNTYEIVMEADVEASSTGTVSINAPNDVSVMGWDLSVASGNVVLGGPLNSGFVFGGQTDDQSYTNVGSTAGLVQAIFAFAAAEWDALSAGVQSALLDPEGASDSALVSFFDDTSDGNGSGGGSGSDGGSVGGEVPLPASVLFLLAGIGALPMLRRRQAT